MLINRCFRTIISVTCHQFEAFYRWDGSFVERLLGHSKGYGTGNNGRTMRLAMNKRLRKALEGLTDPDIERRRRAMEPFVRATFDRFIRYLYRYLGNEVECEDVLEDVYADIWENPDRLKNITNEKQLLRTVYLYYMRKRLREVYRRLNRYLHLSQNDLGNLTAPEPGILEAISQDELKDALNHNLGRLKARERTAIQLWMDGMSNRAIANQLKTTIGAVKMLKFRTLLKLRKMLKDYCSEK
ncbi:MAG: sigma-70 family RNA polymerase sigma factor [Sedimentisphaerales bacterium]|nr:sigma-70 family RNA polymerase sigma factor [Sedimentisphaerales bacterium]